MYIVEMEGEPRQRGQQYGEALRPQIQQHVEDFWQGISQGSGQDPKTFIHMWLGEMNFLPAIEKWTPTLLDEVRGIGEGAGLDYETILSWQFLDELGWYLLYKAPPRTGAQPSEETLPHTGCSSFGTFSHDGLPTLLAQNWDSNIFLDGSQTLLHIRYPNQEYEMYVPVAAGRIGPFGVSSRGIGVCLNSLNEYVNYSPSGLPVNFVGRGILEQPDYASAVSFVQNVQHATGQTYSIGGVEGISIFECSANQVRRYVPEKSSSNIVHTNHPIANTDLRLSPADLENLPQASREEQKTKETNTRTRFNCITDRLESAQPANLDTARAVLRSHDSASFPVCRHPRPDYPVVTMIGMITEFSSPPIFHVASGRPCETEFQTFTFPGK